MYALRNRKAEWELKNEILLGQLKNAAVNVFSLSLFLLWKSGELTIRLVALFFERPKLVRKVGPGIPPEEIQVRIREQVYEQGVR
jgi:hypothetical protein